MRTQYLPTLGTWGMLILLGSWTLPGCLAPKPSEEQEGDPASVLDSARVKEAMAEADRTAAREPRKEIKPDIASRFPVHGDEDGSTDGSQTAFPETGESQPGKTGVAPADWGMYQGGPGHGGCAGDAAVEVPLILQWRFSTGHRFRASPIIAEGRVYVASTDGTVQAVDAAAGNALWEAELDGAVAGTPAFGHGTLCVPGLDGNVYLLDGSNGQTRGKWKTEMPGRDYAAILGQESASVTTDLVVDGEFLHYAGLDGQLYRVHLVKNALVSKTALPGPVRAGGLAVKGRIVVVTCATGELAAVQVGEPQNPLLWKVKVTNPGPDAFLIPPVIAGDTIIVATGRDRYLFARDILNGETTWGVQAPGRVVSLAADSSRVYVTGCSEDTRCALTALSLADGKEAWSIPLTSKTIGPPIVVNGLVVAGLSGGGGCLAAFDAKTGEPLWQGREFTGVSSPPVPYAGRIVVLTDAGYLAAYEPCDVVTDNAMLDAGETIQPPYFDSQGPITDLQWRFARWPQNPAKFVYRMTDFTFIFHPIDDAAPWRVVSKQMLPYEPFLLSPTYTGLLFPTGGGDNLRVIGVRGIDRQSQGFYDVAIRDRTRVLTALILARKLRGQWRPICVNNWFGAWRDDEPGVSDRFIAGYYVNKKRPFEVLTRLADRQALQLLTFFQRSLYLQAPADAVFRGSLVRDGQSPEMRIVVSHYWGRRPKDEQSRLLCGDPNQLMFLELAP